MIEFTVANGRVLHPTRKGLMLRRGSTLLLDPDAHEGHARTAERIRASGGWTERVLGTDGVPAPEATVKTEPREQARAADQAVDPPVEGILPHQAEVISQLRRRAGREY